MVAAEGSIPAEAPPATCPLPAAVPEVEASAESPAAEDPLVVEITYVDPNSGSLCQREVYCDPQDWRDRYQARLLVSSGLVNSVSEAHQTWSTRFREIHRRLEDTRLAYYNELWRVRRYLRGLSVVTQKARERRCSDVSMYQGSSQLIEEKSQEETPAEEAKEEEQSQKSSEKSDKQSQESEEWEEEGGRASPSADSDDDSETCPVHYYLPEMYLDGWTTEHLQKATDILKERLNLEIQALHNKIERFGAASWRQMLQYLLKNGHQPAPLAKSLFDTVMDQEERRLIENIVSSGLRDDYDALQVLIEELKAEVQDFETRWRQVSDRVLDLDEIMEDYDLQMQALRKRQEPPEEEEVAKDPEVIEEVTKQIFEDLEARVEESVAEEKRITDMEEVWTAKLKTIDPEEERRLETMAFDSERKIKVFEIRTGRFENATKEAEARIAVVRARCQEQREAIAGISEQLGIVPPKSPRGVTQKQLLKELHKLQAQERAIRDVIAKAMARTKAMRRELRMLYAKLSWEWDLSDSEEEDEENMPYWRRRQLAVDGFMKFDLYQLLTTDATFRKRSQAYRTKEAQSVEAKRLFAQLEAFTGTIRGLDLSLGPPDEAPDEGQPDAVSAALTHARRRLAAADVTQQPQRQPEFMWEEVEFRHAEQLQRLNELRQCFEAVLGPRPGQPPASAGSPAARRERRPSAPAGGFVDARGDGGEGASPRPSTSTGTSFDTPRLDYLSERVAPHPAVGSTKLPARYNTPQDGYPSRAAQQKPRRRAGRQHGVDFGFRPDGGGEESLENWPLFKVSKGSLDSMSTGLSSNTSLNEKSRRSEAKVRRQRSVECDFVEYMMQSRESAETSWHSASEPSLHASLERKPKSLVSLPQLLGAGARHRGMASSSTLSVCRRDGSKSSLQAPGARANVWSQAPTRFLEPKKKFTATSSQHLYTKW